jgi:hypothetical protein
MKISPHPGFLAVLLGLSVSTSFATAPQALEREGVISIVTDDLGTELHDFV